MWWPKEATAPLIGLLISFIAICTWWIPCLLFINVSDEELLSMRPERKRRKRKRTKPVDQQRKVNSTPVIAKPSVPLVATESKVSPVISKPKPVTDKTLIDESVFALRNLGFKKRDAVIAVERACNGKVFTNVEDVIIATFDRSNV